MYFFTLFVRYSQRTRLNVDPLNLCIFVSAMLHSLCPEWPDEVEFENTKIVINVHLRDKVQKKSNFVFKFKIIREYVSVVQKTWKCGENWAEIFFSWKKRETALQRIFACRLLFWAETDDVNIFSLWNCDVCDGSGSILETLFSHHYLCHKCFPRESTFVDDVFRARTRYSMLFPLQRFCPQKSLHKCTNCK